MLIDQHRKIVKFNAADVHEAAALFYALGTFGAVAEQLGCDPRQLREWSHTAAWTTTVDRLRSQADDELDQRLTRIVEKGLQELEDRLVHGDNVVTKDGLLVKRPVSARDAAWISGVMQDKRTAIRQRAIPTTDAGVEQKLRQIAQQIKDLAAGRSRPPETLDAEVKMVDDDEDFGGLI